jgi:hypothetical protein
MGGALSVRPGAVGHEQDAQPEVTEVPEAVCRPPGLLDEQGDRLGAAVADPVRGEVGQHLGPQVRRVRPSRATSGIGQDGEESSTFSANVRPVAGLVAT